VGDEDAAAAPVDGRVVEGARALVGREIDVAELPQRLG
jgi:hypothetical protein